MSKKVKIIVLLLVFAIVAYYGYKWYSKRKTDAQKAAEAVKPMPVVDRRSGKAIVSDLSNGLDGDIVYA